MTTVSILPNMPIKWKISGILAEQMANWFKDDLDRKIISELQANARQNTSTIAAKLKVSRSTVTDRIARLERLGVITGYSVVLGKNPADERVLALMLVQIKQQELRRIAKQIESYSEVMVCLSIAGEFDLHLSVEAPRIEDLDILIDAISQIPGVLRTQTYIVMGQRFNHRYRETAQMLSKHFNEPVPSK